MKTIIKIFGAALLAGATLALSSCNEEEYTPADPVEGPQVFFSPDNGSTVELSSLESSFDVTILRATKDEAVSFNLEVSDPSGLFTIPTSVSFASGETSFTLTIGYSYNEDDFPFDSYYDLTLSIPDGYNTPYGISEYSFEAGVPGPWTSLGMAQYYDYFFFEEEDNPYEVEIFQNDLDPNQFRLEYPYAPGYVDEGYFDDGDQYVGDQYLTLTIMQPGNSLAGITVTKEGLVYWEPYDTGYYMSSYESDVWLYHPAHFGYEEPDWEYSYVVSYQEPDADGNVLPAVIHLSPMYYLKDYGGGWSDLYDEEVWIAFPGVVIGDYSVDVTYTGKYTDTSNQEYVVGDITLGEDVEYAEAALVAASDGDSAVEAVLNGTADIQTITQSGSVAFPVSEDGTYYIAVVTYGADAAQESAYARVRYSSGAPSFTPTLEGLVGWWDVSCTSYFGAGYDSELYWVIDYSDDEDYDIMLTVFDSFICDYPIYGTFDASTGKFTFYGLQYYLNYYGIYDLYFYTYSDYYISFTLYAEDEFGENTDWFGTLMCDASLDSSDGDYILGWNNLYTDVVGVRIDTDPSLYSVNSASVKAAAKTLARPETMTTNHITDQFERIQHNSQSVQQSSKTSDKSASVKGLQTAPEPLSLR